MPKNFEFITKIFKYAKYYKNMSSGNTTFWDIIFLHRRQTFAYIKYQNFPRLRKRNRFESDDKFIFLNKPKFCDSRLTAEKIPQFL